MKVLGAVGGGMLLSGIGVLYYAVALMEQGEITKDRMALAVAGLVIMGVGVVLSRIAERMEERNEDQGG